MPLKRSPAPSGWFPMRGDVCLFALDKERPAVVLSSNALNRHALDVCVVPVSSVEQKAFRLRPKLPAGEGGLTRESWAKCDQVTTVEIRRAVYPPVGALGKPALQRIEAAVKMALELA